MKKKGFTLVELSIVLVIIGLLIGGILVGQSLIDSAKINQAVRQIQQYDIAVQQFKVKFNGLPGDSDKFQYGGNNDGFIGDGLMSCCGTTQTFEFKGENRNFWRLLQQNGLKIEGISTPLSLVPDSYASNIYVSGPNQDVPKFILGENTAVIPYTKTTATPIGGRLYPWGPNNGEETAAGNFYILGDFSKFGSGVFQNPIDEPNSSIPVMQAMAFDKKIDDGSPVTGIVINSSIMFHGNGAYCQIAWWSDQYSSSATNPLCSLVIRMDY